VTFVGVNGYLDKLPVAKVGDFEQGFLAIIRSQHKDILEEIRTKKELSDGLRERLRSAADSFSKAFA